MENKDKITSGDFNLQTDMKVFIDMGHDTIKCARIYDNDWQAQLNHFEVPTLLIKELVIKHKQLLKTSNYDFERKTNTSFKFYKNNIDQLTERVLNDKNSRDNSSTYLQRPMINGLIQEGYLQDFEFMWENIGRMFVQGMEAAGAQQDELEASWGSIHSRVMMTDPSLTMAANDQNLIENAQKQRRKIAEIAFETLGISEFSLLPAQLPQMLSELCMDGIVVDLGHEMTQIVPIFNGMVDMRKVNTFPVGGITMDVILMNMWREDQKKEGRPNVSQFSKFTQFRARTRFKEELAKLGQPQNQQYRLPDNEYFKIDYTEESMHPIKCYLSSEYYSSQFGNIIQPLHNSRLPNDRRMSFLMSPQTDFSGQRINPKVPQETIPNETLHNKIVEGAEPKYPITDTLFKTMRDYCEDEEIKEFDKLQNIIIVGGGANMGQFKRSSRCEPTNETLGSLLVNDFKKAISAESVTGLNVILSMDPRLAIMQGANVLMNLSSNSKHYVSSQDYFESGNERDNLINQILF